MNNIFGCFSRLGNFLHVFGQVKELLIFEVQEMIRVSDFVACPMNVNLLCDLGQQGGVLKLLKKYHFLIFADVWVSSLSYLGRLRTSLY